MPKMASRPDVMDLQVLHGTAILAMPIIPRENFLPKFLVSLWSEPHPRLSRP